MSHPSEPRRTRAVGATFVALMLGALAACAPTGGVPIEDPGNTVVRDFGSQALAWESCDGYVASDLARDAVAAVSRAQCTNLRVPMDHSMPNDDRTASIAVIRIPARGESLGMLVFNPGGPGAAGVPVTALVAGALADSPLTERFDLVSVDPRGTGASQPAADCGFAGGTDGSELFRQVSAVLPSLDERATRELVDACADGTGGLDALANMGTRTVARDLDILREALGEERLNFFGQSYGTRLGAIYAEQFPDRVRAMVLDGAFHPARGQADRLLSSYAGFQNAFDRMAAACAAEADCPLGTDPAGWTPALQALLRPLADEPVPAGAGSLDFDSALGGVVGGLYAPEAWPTVIDGLREIQNGRGDLLRELSLAIGGADPSGTMSNQIDAQLVISCADEAAMSAQQLADLREAAYRAAPILDPGTPPADGLRDKCADFPRTGELAIPYADAVDDLPAPLVVSILNDPTTPHDGAIALAEALGGSLLSVDGDGHTVVSAGTNACVNAIVAAYLIDLDLPEKEMRCAL